MELNENNVKSILENLKSEINSFFEANVIEYIDIVSVDLINQKNEIKYEVFFYGPEIEKRYVNFINSYFDIKKQNKSLLNIEVEDKHFLGFSMNGKVINDKKYSVLEKSYSKNKFDLFSQNLGYKISSDIKEEKIEIHFNRWINSLKEYYPNLKHVFFHKKGIQINQREVVVAAIWLGLSKSISPERTKLIDILIKNTLNSHILFSLIPLYLFALKKQSIKSAIAAIMSRNMSHNLGSHILSYLKNALSEIPKIWENNLAEFKKIEEAEKIDSQEYVLKLSEKLIDKIKIEYTDKSKGEAPFLLGLGHFLNYLQERQDFIATIASDFIPYFGTINFKDSIYDELNRDLKIIRHGKVENMRYNMKNILLEYIAYSENFNRERIKIFFHNFNGIEDHDDLDRLRTIACDFPGGIIGRQAFFSIFENIIRNAAKHGGKTKEQLIFTILVEEEDKYNEFWKVSIFDNNENANKAIIKLRRALHEGYVDETGKIIETNKGIKEIRISAAWLRSENVAEINEQNMEDGLPPILSINRIIVNEKTKKWEQVSDKYDEKTNELILFDDKSNLCYTFYLQKTQKVVFVTKDTDDIFIQNININQNNLFEIKELSKYKAERNRNYDLILIDKELGEKETQNIKLFSPPRCLTEIDLLELKEKFTEAHKISTTRFIEDTVNDYFYTWIEANYLEDIEEININILEPYIAIIDKSVYEKTEKKIYPEKTKRIKIYKDLDEFINDSSKSKHQLIFRAHNDNEEEFDLLRYENKSKKIRKEFTNAKFLEGISGHNSTDRLIRSLDFTEEWALRMTESALTNILIFDERIFQRLNGNSDKAHYMNFKNEEKEHFKNINSILNDKSNNKEKQEKLRKYLKDKIGFETIDDKLVKMIKNTISEHFDTKIEDLFNYLNTIFDKEENKETTFSKELYDKKNIHVFNLFEHNNSFIVADINNEKIGVLKIENNELIIDLSDYGNNPANFRVEYDFVITHQGLLDKLYGNFSRQLVDYSNFDDRKLKEDVFLNFRKIFNAKHKQIIHSGRSKPEMLPENTIFNQFSSVENAFFDCKFSLTELLYSARPEKQKWTNK